MAETPVIVWFRQDLRLADNRALAAAATTGRPVLPVYVHDVEAGRAWVIGGASRWWLHGSLTKLDAALRRIGSRLILRRGQPVATLIALAEATGARTIHFSRCYEPDAVRVEAALKTAGEKAGIEVKRYSGALLNEPETIRTKGGEPFRVFTPFWRATLAATVPKPLEPAPERLTPPEDWPASDALDAWMLLPHMPDWAGGLRATWAPGEAGARSRLETLMDGALGAYAEARDRPDLAGTSMLSPHLHFGEVTPRQCWHAIGLARERDAVRARGADAFLREIGWREFSYHLLYHFPQMTDEPFRREYAAFPWRGEADKRGELLQAWQHGRTGYPIVDAGMRQLWETGWMHNRVRMIVASFLTKHLLIPWRDGARWFWDTLVDADLASNSASWQWVAGSGADAAPYFRIFNPLLQGAKFDPEGTYVRRFVPELAKLSAAHIHAPWDAPEMARISAGVRLGASYPLPIIDHAAARERALAAYATLRQTAGVARAADDAEASRAASKVRKASTSRKLP